MTNTNTEQTRDRIWQIIETINRIFMDGKGFDRIGPFFHDCVVMLPPGFNRRAEGKATCLRYYEDAGSQMVLHKLEGSDKHIDVWGNTAVVTYRYDCIWDYQGKTFKDNGYEILVFIKEDENWQITWRTSIPGSRQIEKCPTEEEQTNVQVSKDVKQTSLNLINNMPVCHLTTIDSEGFPHTSAMNNLRYARQYHSLVEVHEEEDNDFVLYLSTSMQSPKMKRMQYNPKVSVYFCDANQFVGLMLGGEMEIVTDKALKNRIWQKGWTMYYPNGPEGPEYGVVKLVPSTVKGWCQNGPFSFEL